MVRLIRGDFNNHGVCKEDLPLKNGPRFKIACELQNFAGVPKMRISHAVLLAASCVAADFIAQKMV